MRVTNVCFSRKHYMELIHFQMKVMIFQSKASTETRNTVLTFNNTLTYPKQWLIFSEKDMCISHKTISWNSHSFKRTWLSFKVKYLQTQGHSSHSNNSVTYDNVLSFQSNTCAFLTKAFCEIHTLLKERDYLSKESFFREVNTVLRFVKSLTYHKQRLIISEKDMCVSQ